MACGIVCAKVVFAQVPPEALKAIKDVCAIAKQSLATLKIAKQAMSINMDVSLIPLQAKKQILEAVISTVRDKTHVIPGELVLQCPQVGAINTLLESSLIGAIEGVSNMIFDIDRLESLKLAVSADIEQIDVAVDFFTEIVDCIEEVLNS